MTCWGLGACAQAVEVPRGPKVALEYFFSTVGK
jgi:hypothetical protein